MPTVYIACLYGSAAAQALAPQGLLRALRHRIGELHGRAVHGLRRIGSWLKETTQINVYVYDVYQGYKTYIRSDIVSYDILWYNNICVYI